MNKEDTITVVIKRVHTDYQEYTLTFEEFEEYMEENFTNDNPARHVGGLVTYIPKLWKWMKSKNGKKHPNQILFTCHTQFNIPEASDQPVTLEYGRPFYETIYNKLNSLITIRQRPAQN